MSSNTRAKSISNESNVLDFELRIFSLLFSSTALVTEKSDVGNFRQCNEIIGGDFGLRCTFSIKIIELVT